MKNSGFRIRYIGETTKQEYRNFKTVVAEMPPQNRIVYSASGKPLFLSFPWIVFSMNYEESNGNFWAIAFNVFFRDKPLKSEGSDIVPHPWCRFGGALLGYVCLGDAVSRSRPRATIDALMVDYISAFFSTRFTDEPLIDGIRNTEHWAEMTRQDPDFGSKFPWMQYRSISLKKFCKESLEYFTNREIEDFTMTPFHENKP